MWDYGNPSVNTNKTTDSVTDGVYFDWLSCYGVLVKSALHTELNTSLSLNISPTLSLSRKTALVNVINVWEPAV
jgi:hypothetical protein